MVIDSEAELRQLIRDGKCVVVVGAGLSIPPGPDWNGLVRNMARRCGVRFDRRTSWPRLIDRCIAKNERICNDTLRELLPAHIAHSRPAVGYLHRLPFKAMLTTNFDPWIHQQSQRERYDRCHVYPDLPLHRGLDSGIYYLHGRFDSEDKSATIKRLIFGERSFREAYATSLLSGFLLNVFTYENVLFVGFNPTEPRIAELLRQSISIRRTIGSSSIATSSHPPKRFVLWEAPLGMDDHERAKEDSMLEQIRVLELVPVLYDRISGDRRGLEALLLSWIQQGNLQNRPAPDVSGFDLNAQPQTESVL